MMRTGRIALGLIVAILFASPPAASADFADLHGIYLGYAVVFDPVTGRSNEREMTVDIEPYKRRGLRIKWTSVQLVDGRRDRPGVTYRNDEMLLLPSDNGNYFVASAPHSPFEQRASDQPLSGDPLRWATFGDDGLNIFSFVILDDGRYELQRYQRLTAEGGMTLTFERIVDGELVRQISGFARKIADPRK